MRYDKVQKMRGDILLTVLVFAAITLVVTIALVRWGSIMLAEIRNVKANEQAFQVAEAGIDYYRWHLAQYPTDYKDGTTGAGPYIHQFFDKNGNVIGSYSITITPPPVGSTIVKITSTGTASSTASSTAVLTRKVQATMAIPSLAKFAVVANDNMNFGIGTEVFGPVHSNGGIHFDGVTHNLISSALTTYTDPDTGLNQWAVYTTSGTDDPRPNTPVNNRPDVFMAGRQSPVPEIDFSGLTYGLTQLQTLAQNGGKEWYSTSPAKGYHIVLRSDGTYDYDLYKVTSLVNSPSSNCANSKNQSTSQDDWGTWSISAQTPYPSTGANHFMFPSNGVIFFDDNVWVDGQIDGSRITIVAGITSSHSVPDPSITINKDLKYTKYDGGDVIGLIAQGNINVGLVSDDALQIDAALVAENGRVGRYYYNSSCNISDPNYPGNSQNRYYNMRDSLTANGMIATGLRYGFAYGSASSITSGYENRNLNYDGNLLYGPPPSFPQATTQYQMISWKEVQ